MRLTSTLFSLISSLLVCAQGKEMTLRTDSGTLQLHYFTTGQLSSRAWMDADNRWGHSWAYNRQGEVIFDRQTRGFAGHASVDYRYHPNGGISRADVSAAPDGGIQWYKSTTTFDTSGTQTGFSEAGYDHEGPIGPRVRPAYPQEEVREQRMFINEYYLVARKNCRVQIRPKQTSPGARDMDATLLKGDTLRGGTYSMGERFDPPFGHVAVTATNRRGKPKYKVTRVDSVQVNESLRRWYLILGR